MHHNDGDDPTIQDYGSVLDKLFQMITPAAPKHPELIEQEMAADTDEISDRHCN
jgi:hypothetical protein